MKTISLLSSFLLALSFSFSAAASTKTSEMLTKCERDLARESVLSELEAESGLNLDLETLAGDAQLTTLVEEAQTRNYSKASAQALKNIRRILKVTRQGVQDGKVLSLKQSTGLNAEVASVLADYFLAMMDIFTPVLDYSERGQKAQAQGKTLPEIESQMLMDDLTVKTSIFEGSQASLTKFQEKMATMTETERQALSAQMDSMVLNIHIQTCKAAVREFRK